MLMFRHFKRCLTLIKFEWGAICLSLNVQLANLNSDRFLGFLSTRKRFGNIDGGVLLTPINDRCVVVFSIYRRSDRKELCSIMCGVATNANYFGTKIFCWVNSLLGLLKLFALCKWYLRDLCVKARLRLYWSV